MHRYIFFFIFFFSTYKNCLVFSDLVCFWAVFWFFGGLVWFIDTQFVCFFFFFLIVVFCLLYIFVLSVYIKVVCLRSILYNVVVVFVPLSVFVSCLFF